MNVSTISRKALLSSALFAGLLALGACNNADDNTSAGEKLDAAIDSTERSADQVVEKAQEMTQDAKEQGSEVKAAVTDAAGEAMDKAKEMTADAKAQGAEVKAAVTDAAGQAMDKAQKMAADAKTQGAAAASAVGKVGDGMVGAASDASISAAVSAGLAKDQELSAIKIDVATTAGKVTLSGPAPSAAAKMRAEEIAKGVKGVNAVDNRLDVKM